MSRAESSEGDEGQLSVKSGSCADHPDRTPGRRRTEHGRAGEARNGGAEAARRRRAEARQDEAYEDEGYEDKAR